MADHSKIEWTDATWNPVAGCQVVSPGCTNCYAMRLVGTRLQAAFPARYGGLTAPSKAGPVWNGQMRLLEDALTQPLRWRRPRRIFVNSLSDLFAEGVPDAWIDQVFAVMALTPQHTYQLLTKRPERMRAYVKDRAPKLARFMIDEYLIKAPDCPPNGRRAINLAWPVVSIGDIDDPDDVTMKDWPLPNLHLGVSAEDQTRADERIPTLLTTPAAVRFVSIEPMLGPMDLTELDVGGDGEIDALNPRTWGEEIDCWVDTSDTWEEDFLDWYSLGSMPDRAAPMHPTLDQVIVGGESGPGARPMHPDWPRQIRDACAAAGVPFFFKQWGDWAEAAEPSHWVSNTGGVRPVGSGVWASEAPMARICKRAAGRLLDGVEHNGQPEGR